MTRTCTTDETVERTSSGYLVRISSFLSLILFVFMSAVMGEGVNSFVMPEADVSGAFFSADTRFCSPWQTGEILHSEADCGLDSDETEEFTETIRRPGSRVSPDAINGGAGQSGVRILPKKGGSSRFPTRNLSLFRLQVNPTAVASAAASPHRVFTQDMPFHVQTVLERVRPVRAGPLG